MFQYKCTTCNNVIALKVAPEFTTRPCNDCGNKMISEKIKD